MMFLRQRMRENTAQIVNGVHSVDHCFAAGVVHAEIQFKMIHRVESAYMAPG